MLAAGLMTIMCSLEICLRLSRANKRVQDPDLDNLTNPHEVKHWMDPKIIPYGWGMFADNDDDGMEHVEGSPSCIMIPILSVDTRQDCKDEEVRHGNTYYCHAFPDKSTRSLKTFLSLIEL